MASEEAVGAGMAHLQGGVLTPRGARWFLRILAFPLLMAALGGCSTLGSGIAREDAPPEATSADVANWARRGRPLLPTWRESVPEEHDAGARAAGGVDLVGLIGHALSLDGIRYRSGGSSPEIGFDCSGFVRYLYSQLGIDLPHSSAEQFLALPGIERRAMRPGDLVFFRTAGSRRISHVGVFLGGDRFIHASSSRTRRVMVSGLGERYWSRTWAGARRVPVGEALVTGAGDARRVASQP